MIIELANGRRIQNVELKREKNMYVYRFELNETTAALITEYNFSKITSIDDGGNTNTVEGTIDGKRTRAVDGYAEVYVSTNDYENQLSQNTADIDAINEAIAALAEIIGGE